MNTQDFAAAVRRMAGLPDAVREKFLALADKMSPEDRKRIIAQLITLDADLNANDHRYLASIQRTSLMIREVRENDLPVLENDA